MQIFKVLSLLLSYPEIDLVTALPEIRHLLEREQVLSGDAHTLLRYLEQTDLIELQQNYVQTFDRTPSHSLHLFEHLHGESRTRGQAMVDLLQEYKNLGLEPVEEELPDYLPLFLEFLSMLPERECVGMLADAINVITHIGNNLRHDASPYACIFDILQAYSPIAADPSKFEPTRMMDDTLETIGPNAEGVEPLLGPKPMGEQPIIFSRNFSQNSFPHEVRK